MTAWYTSDLWALLALGALGAGILLLVLGLKRRFHGTDPHCAKCDYNLTGAASLVCPECGTARRPDTTVYGECRRRPWCIGIGASACLLGLVLLLPAGLSWWNTPKSAPIPGLAARYVSKTKRIISNLRSTFAVGKADIDTTYDHSEPFFYLVPGLLEGMIPASIQSGVKDTTVKSNALAKLSQIATFLDSQVIPAFKEAYRSRNPADAKALVPLMDQLDKQVDQLQQILEGY